MEGCTCLESEATDNSLHKAALALMALCLSQSTPFLVLKLLMAFSLGVRHRGSSHLLFSRLFCSFSLGDSISCSSPHSTIFT